MATLTEVDEERLIREQIDQIKFPKGLRFERIESMREWTGEPAFRIYFAVSLRKPLTQRRLDEVGRVERELSEKILGLQLDKWPYFELLEEA